MSVKYLYVILLRYEVAPQYSESNTIILNYALFGGGTCKNNIQRHFKHSFLLIIL